MINFMINYSGRILEDHPSSVTVLWQKGFAANPLIRFTVIYLVGNCITVNNTVSSVVNSAIDSATGLQFPSHIRLPIIIHVEWSEHINEQAGVDREQEWQRLWKVAAREQHLEVVEKYYDELYDL